MFFIRKWRKVTHQNLGINFVLMYLKSRNAFHTKVAESDAPKSGNKFCPHVSGIFDPTFYESRLAPLASLGLRPRLARFAARITG